ncbi:MAG TPA: PKD domain-containing protein [Methanosarcina sp.]|nr:PKD domain-containing protein [Methanosarcina sp.]
MKRTIGVLLISIFLLSVTTCSATAATTAHKTPANQNVTVKKLNADFKITYNPKAPLTVKFKDTSTGSPIMWAWDFGDKTKFVNTKNPTHTYKKPGTYTVTLKVFNAKGQTSKAKKVLTYTVILTVNNVEGQKSKASVSVPPGKK